MKLVIAAFAVVAALAAATPAQAQPSLTPLSAPAAPIEPARPPAEAKDGTTALLLSLGGAAGSLGLFLAGANMQGPSGERLVAAGVLSSIVSPSFGHWYAGDYLTGGLAVRGAGGVVFLIGVGQALSCFGENCDADNGAAAILIGAGLYIGGAVLDIATAPSAASRWNAHHLQLAPTVVTSGTHNGMGLGFGGTF